MKLDRPTLKTLTRVIGAHPCNFLAVRAGKLEGIGVGRSHTFFVRFSPTEGDQYVGALRLSWLKRLTGIAGKRSVVELLPNLDGAIRSGRIEQIDCAAFGEATARVNGTTYHAEWLLDDVCPAFPERRAADIVTDRRELAPADFARGGAVAIAAGFASSDYTRAALNAVHVDGIVSATDGHRLARRRPVADLAGFDALVPLDVVRALLTIAQAHSPTAARVVRYTGDTRKRYTGTEWVERPELRIRFQLVTPVGEWVIDAPLVDSAPPAYQHAAERSEDERLVAVNVDDLRAMVYPFRRDPRVAIYPDGRFVAWGYRNYDGAVGTTLEHMPAVEPLVVLGPVLEDLLKVLPKSGEATLGIDGATGAVRFGDELFMPVIHPDLPLSALEVAFVDDGTGPAVRTCEATADACTNVPVFERCAPPTAAVNDNARAA